MRSAMSLKSKQSTDDRRVSFSNNPLEQLNENDEEQRNTVIRKDKNTSVKYEQVENIHQPLLNEKKTGKDNGKNQGKPEDNLSISKRFMQRKGAIADESAHQLLVKEAVVKDKLRISGLDFDD